MRQIRPSQDTFRIAPAPEPKNKREAAKSKAKGNVVRIAGYANKFGIDTYGTRFDPKSVRLDRFRQNGMLLFNHNINLCVGSVTKVETRDDGIWVEAEISTSADPQVSYVRDLVEEERLRTFSIRFGDDCKFEKDPEIPGAMLVRDWELMEVSIVTIPSQANSTFTLRHAAHVLDNCRSLEEAREAVSKVRGSSFASFVNEAIRSACTEGKTRLEIVEQLREASGMEREALEEVLSGEVVPAPEELVEACITVLGCEKAALQEMNSEDEDGSEEEESAETPVPEETTRAEDGTDDAMQSCVAEKIPALLKEGKAQDEAVAIAIQVCSAERGCTGWRPKPEHLAHFLEVCQRQATQDPAGPSVAITSEVPNDNPMLLKLDSLVSLMGSLVEEVKGLKAALVEARKEQPTETPAPATVPESVPPPPVTEDTRAVEDAFRRIDARLKARGV